MKFRQKSDFWGASTCHCMSLPDMKRSTAFAKKICLGTNVCMWGWRVCLMSLWYIDTWVLYSCWLRRTTLNHPGVGLLTHCWVASRTIGSYVYFALSFLLKQQFQVGFLTWILNWRQKSRTPTITMSDRETLRSRSQRLIICKGSYYYWSTECSSKKICTHFSYSCACDEQVVGHHAESKEVTADSTLLTAAMMTLASVSSDGLTIML